MATYVFSLGLIPVQEWIAQARRSRDLKAGSAILCRLTAGALEALGTEGIEILVQGRRRQQTHAGDRTQPLDRRRLAGEGLELRFRRFHPARQLTDLFAGLDQARA